MKKKKTIILLLLITSLSVSAASTKFTIDTSKMTLSNSKKTSITKEFNDNYNLKKSISNIDSKLEKEITTLTKKTTYLLLGDFNNTTETSEAYYKRRQDYSALRYNPEVPKDENSFSGLDENSQEYKDDLVSGITLPGVFNEFNKLNVVYTSFGDIRISKSDNLIMSSITLPNVRMREENPEKPMEYKTIETNLTIYYTFKELNGEYKLYYLMGETHDSLDDYFIEMENQENSVSFKSIAPYDSNLKEIYSYEKINSLSTETINNIYNANYNKIFTLTSHYNNYEISSANGFLISDGLVITTWNFLEEALVESQYISIKDSNNNIYKIDGVVTINPETDIAIIKLKDKITGKVVLGNYQELKTEDPAIVISSKTGVGLTVQKGIIISNDSYIQSSIPLSKSDEGSPLFNQNGQVIGLNTSKQTNTSISISINSEVLEEIQEKFNNIEFNALESITFDELKEKYYYTKYNEEIVENNIPTSKWKKYSKIGNIKDTIKLKLLKANYKDGIISLRYENTVSDFIGSMQLATAFKEQLIKDGYKETLKGNKKCIYENGRYQIVIMDEFNYLIIVMVKL